MLTMMPSWLGPRFLKIATKIGWSSTGSWLPEMNWMLTKLTLGINQQKSYMVLRDFFEEAYHDESRPFEVIQQNWHLGDRNDSEAGYYNDEVTYSQAISNLFAMEMDPGSNSVYSMSSLTFWRIEAIKHAAAQRTAYFCLVSCKMSHGGIGNVKKLKCSGPFMTPQSIHSSSQALSMPYYLWDIAREQTVTVNKLGFVPTYTCVSHTWGRWPVSLLVKLDGVDWPIPGNSRFDVRVLPLILKRASWATAFIWLDLVCIPQLDFDLQRKAKEISNQGGIFAGATACVAWLNDVVSWERLMPAMTWLGLSYLQYHSGLQHQDIELLVLKAATDAGEGQDLFRKRNFPVPNDAPQETHEVNLDGDTQSGVESFHSKYCCQRPSTECLTHSRALEAKCSSDIRFDFAQIFGFPDWFTSLWTLQEACLFPEMSLATSSFEYLSSSKGVHITLEAVCFLCTVVKTTKPRSVKQLSLCFRHDFGYSTPMDVFLVGNERQCTGERAPAIMSVLGITDWYDEQIASTGQANGSQDLVLGKYPMSFVEEAASKIGPLFFGTCADGGLHDAIGSMLPFFSGDDGSARFPFTLAGVRKGAKGYKWQIGRSGKVDIDRVIILGASRGNPYNIAPVELSASIFGLDMIEEEADLQETLDFLRGNDERGCAFAVHLSQDTIRFMGIILAGTRSSVSDEILLAKCAAYQILYDEEMAVQVIENGVWLPVPEPRKVDWIAF